MMIFLYSLVGWFLTVVGILYVFHGAAFIFVGRFSRHPARDLVLGGMLVFINGLIGIAVGLMLLERASGGM